MKTKHAKLAVALTTMVSLAAITACGNSGGAGSSNQGGNANQNSTSTTSSGSTQTLNIGLSADPPTLDPSLSSALVDRQVMFNLYDTLFQLEPNNTIGADLVQSYQISNGGKTYTFHLHPGVTFTDGTPFNAAAVKFNLQRDMAPASARHSSLSLIQSIETPDSATVVIHLKQPFSPLLAILAGRAGMMVSPAAVQKEGSNFASQPIGTGPFEFKDRVKGDHITLIRNPHYWNGEPKLAQVTYKIFTDPNVELANLESGAVQMIDTVPPQQLASMQSNANYTVVNKVGLGYQGFYLNVSQPPFNNPYLRQAVNLAINRQTLVNVVVKGEAQPGYSPFSSASPVYNAQEDTPPPVDAAKVKQLLQQGGKPNGFSFTMQAANSPITLQMVQIIQSMLSQFGIKMKIDQLEFGTLLANNENHAFQASQLGWSGRLDPDQDIYSFFVSGGPLNASNYSNSQVDHLLNLAREQTNMADRAKTYAKVMDLLHKDAPYVFLFHQNNTFAYSNQVQGFQYYSDGVIRVDGLSLQ